MQNIFSQIDKIFEEDANEPPLWAQELLKEVKEVKDMLNSDLLICYDISCEKRLRKIAKYLEKVSIRIQKSIFFYPQATLLDAKFLVSTLNQILDENKDDIRIYKIDINPNILSDIQI